ncbi:MAG: diguanylate cyclase [Alphaproteobacteria bacterium]|nr:diguanylate cyclase [Alphaproteobacteria bacterium]
MDDLKKLENLFDFNLLDKYQLEALENLASEVSLLKRKNEALLKKVQEYEQQEGASAILSHNDFNREVARMLAFDERYGGTTSILYFDFSGLEKLSDTKEAVYRDFVKAISDTLVSHVRKSDIVGRVAKSEFGILLLRCENDFAWSKARILAALLEEALFYVSNAHNETLKISYGAYTFGEKETALSGLKKAAKALTSV